MDNPTEKTAAAAPAAGALIAARLEAVRGRIAAACTRAHRPAGSVRLILASKTQPPAAIAAAYAAGAREFGENYVQEAVTKRAALAPLPDARWHLIGHLQRNKARVAADNFDLVQTLDSRRLAAALHRVHPAPLLAALIEVNLAGEAAKSGVAADEVEALITAVRGQVEIRGLMTVPPEAPAATSRRWFNLLRELRDRLVGPTGLVLPELSMGMTNDYETAIEEGATIVRVGRAVFGARK